MPGIFGRLMLEKPPSKRIFFKPYLYEMEAELPEDDWMPTFYVGQHESKRQLPVTEHVLRQAHDCNVSSHPAPFE